MKEYNENNQIKEETITMQDLPEQKDLNRMNAPMNEQPEKKQEENKEKKGSKLVKVLILIIIILLLLNACSAYYFKKEIDRVEKDCEASCNSKYKLPGDADKDINSPDSCKNPDSDDDNNNKDDDNNKEDENNKNPDDNRNPDGDRKPQVDNRVFKVRFTNPRVKDGSMQGSINITEGSTALSFNSELNIPGDYFTFYVDVVNTGEVNAKIGGSPLKSSLTPDQSRYLAYEVRYADGSEIREEDSLAIGETKTLEFKIEFMREITVDDLPKQDETINFTYELTYVEK